MNRKGDILKKLRKEREMTQAQFSEWLEIPKRTYEKWESEESEPPTWVVKLIQFKCGKSTQGDQITIDDLNDKTDNNIIITPSTIKESFNVLYVNYDSDIESLKIYRENDPFYDADVKFRKSEDEKGYRFTPTWETFKVYRI